MDPQRSLFSRGATPPGSYQDQTLQPQSLNNYQHASPTHSLREQGHLSSPTHVEALFNNLNLVPGAQQPQPQSAASSFVSGAPQASSSAPATPVSITGQSVSSATSAPAHSTSESRQSALLSLLGTVGSPASSTTSGPQQIPTPPGSLPRSGPTANNESQGRMLLEQLMGHAPQSNYAEPPPATLPPPSANLNPTFPSSADDQHETGSYYEPDTNTPQTAPRDDFQVPIAAAQPPPSQQQPLAPPPPSMFDFVSPFDALASTPPSSARKPPPPVSHQAETSSGNEEWPISNVNTDAKRKSVENLIEQLTRGQPPLSQMSTSPYELPTSSATDDATSSEPTQASRQPQSRPLPPKPYQAPSPRNSPPKVHAQQQRRDVRQTESPLGPLVGSPIPPALTAHAPAPRDKESSPGPRGSWNNKEGRRGNSKAKSNSSQTIIFDVAQPLEEIQAPREAVKSTAIALVRVDSTFLPGTTIGATQWVAYAMTKGRVRVISRSSGDRTLLQLPHEVFSPATAVTDMAVIGNRLAGVTSDGGLVVWELPAVITDDVPGKILLCVLPTLKPDGLQAVKWHPRQPDVLAVTSENSIFVLNIIHALHMFGGEPIDVNDIMRVSQTFSIPSTLVAFDFDVDNGAIATITEDSTLTLWDAQEQQLIWSSKIRGDDIPSSLTLVDSGVIIGRKHGTVFQLLPTMRSNVLSTIKFVNGDREDFDMFGHANYDSKLQTLWVANNRRDSMIAFRLGFEYLDNDDVRGSFSQAIEFLGPKPTIHFVILTAESDPNGDEAHAACVAAKVTPGELALVAFSVHSTGVDQILIRKEWFDTACAGAVSKLPAHPTYHAIPAPVENRNTRSQPQPPPVQRQREPSPPPREPIAQPPPVERLRTPPSEEVEAELTREPGRQTELRGKSGRNRNVGWKDKDESSGKEKPGKGGENSNNTEAIGATMAKEMKKMEENLYSRIGRLVGKELDKQQQRLEDVRVSEQQADFDRQEKILRLVSSELSKNTTRVVEGAIKQVVQNSVLPALESITKTEVKNALNAQIAKGLGDSMNKALPAELEKMLFRPEISSHITQSFSSAITPVIEKQVKDAIQKTLIPAYSQQSANMHQELTREMQAEMLNIKNEVTAWQSEALRGQEVIIRDLDKSVRALADQVKFLSLNSPATSAPLRHPSPPMSNNVPQYNQQRQLPPQAPMPIQSYAPMPSHQVHQHQSHQPPPMQMSGGWGQHIPAPQASHPALPPPTAPMQMRHSPPPQQEDWDETYLTVLGNQDTRQLRELLARSNPEVVMPLNGPSPLSQAAILTIVHKLSAAIGESAPVDEAFKSSIWWLQRAATVLKTTDPIIAPYIIRVMPTVQSQLNVTKQRIAILPGGAQVLETVRSISEIQDILSHKAA